MNKFLSLFFIFLLAGCTITQTPEKYDSSSPLSASEACTYEPTDYNSTGEQIEGGYNCHSSSPIANYAGNLCSWVNSYTRKDGTYVSGHTRCKYNHLPSTSSSSSSSSATSCVTSYCGPVNVRGYYRKDGTYVRPHTRSRASSGSRRR